MVCPKRDGYPTFALYDTTGSGKPDMIGYFHYHEFKPYKMEPYTGQSCEAEALTTPKAQTRLVAASCYFPGMTNRPLMTV